MRRRRTALEATCLAVCVSAAGTLPARAAEAAGAHVLPAAGAAMHYRITRTAQGNSGMRTAVSNVTLHRKSATSLTLQGVFGSPSSAATALTVTTGSQLQVPSDVPSDTADSALADVIAGLNAATELLAGKTAEAHGSWSATASVAGTHGSSTTVTVPIAMENVSGGNFEFHGVGQTLVQSPAPSQMSAQFGTQTNPQQILGRHGGLRGRGPVPQQPTAVGAPQQSFTVVLSVDGRVRHGNLSDITIVETRSLTVDGLPYVNVSGWTIAAAK
jgi:hypothetical protein